MEKLTEAIHFAAVAHRDQRRKNSSKAPYINHPIEVMNLLCQAGVKDITILCAAVLHDTIEDTCVTHVDLCNKFGKTVADIVVECSDDKSLPKEIRKQEQINHARVASFGAKLVKAADKLSNLRDLNSNPPVGWSKETIDGYFTWSYAVWLAIRGCNKDLDKQLSDLFSTRNLLHISPEELELKLAQYYENIKGGN